MQDEGWDIMSGNAIEDIPKLEPSIEIKFKNCELALSGALVKLIRDCGMKQESTTLNPDGSRSIFFRLGDHNVTRPR